MRYYTYCLFSPSVKSFGSLYKYSDIGLIFHDTEEAITVKDIIIPLRRFFIGTDNRDIGIPNEILTVKVDNNTVVATGCTDSFPTPIKLFSSERLSQVDLSGWIIQDLNDPNSIEAINYSQIYDKCTRLERLMGNCPCSLLDGRKRGGECEKQHVFPHLRTSGYTRASFYTDVFKRKSLQQLESFQFVPPGYTTDTLFEESLRNWDSIDFSLVSQNRKYYKSKGQELKARNKFRNEACSVCCFSEEGTDCGWIRHCKGAKSEKEVLAALYRWYYNDSGFNRIPGFTRAQRDALIAAGGSVLKTKALGSTRNIETVLGGFVRPYTNVRPYKYLLCSNRGDASRNRRFVTSYAELKTLIPQIDTYLTQYSQVTRPNKTLLCAALAGKTCTRRIEDAMYSYPIKHIRPLIRDDTIHGVVITTTNSRHEHLTTLHLEVSNTPSYLFKYGLEDVETSSRLSTE